MQNQEEVAVIPLVEERVSVAKKSVETSRLRVSVSVEERQEMVPVDLAHDEVEIERIPRNVTVTDPPSVRLEGGTTIIPVVEEVVVMEKRLVLVEEIHVRRKSSTRSEQVPVMLRSERADVQQSDAIKDAGPQETR